METILRIHDISKDELILLIKNTFNNCLEEQKQDTKEYYSVKEVAQFLSVSELSIYNYIKKGTITSNKVGRKHLIHKVDLNNALSMVKSLKYKRGL